MQNYTSRKFSAQLSSGHTVSHDVYTKRPESPTGKDTSSVVMIVQELPGIGQETLSLADEFVSEGFTVVLPHLFGPLGKTDLVGNLIRVMCLRKEFNMFAKGVASPVVDWLRALCHELTSIHKVKGVAVIGMCLTGNFAMSLMADETVLAGVASQPSMPIGSQRDLQMSQAEIERSRQRLEEHGPMLAYRFAGDRLCQAAKFKCIDATFNREQERVRLKTLPGKGHAVLTLDFVDEAGHPTRQALDEILSYFRRALTET